MPSIPPPLPPLPLPPRCGRVITRGHRQHLEPCQGPPEPVQLSEEQLAEQAAAQVEQDKRKLQELELGGLVELGADEATFVVVGSTGNHYVVTFSDERRTCQCMDHRWGAGLCCGALQVCAAAQCCCAALLCCAAAVSQHCCAAASGARHPSSTGQVIAACHAGTCQTGLGLSALQYHALAPAIHSCTCCVQPCWAARLRIAHHTQSPSHPAGSGGATASTSS